MSRKQVFFGIFLLLTTAAGAQDLPQPESTPLALYGEALHDADHRLVGRGVVLDGLERPVKARATRSNATSSLCGTAADIVWREVRRETDSEGGSHVFYRQHLVGATVEAELVGSEIAVHRLPDGKLIGIGGRQFESVTVSGCPAMTAAKAVDAARERVLLYQGEYARHREPWTMDAFRAGRMARTKLKLVEIDGVFRPAYFTVAEDAAGEPHSVVLDAVDERLLAIRESNPGSNCAPNEPLSQVTAYGVPVRPELTNWRTLQANTATRGPDNFTHEGVLLSSDGTIRHLVYQGADLYHPYRCSYDRFYTLFPLRINTGVYAYSPTYEDITVSNKAWAGRAAGDALWHTYRTMFVFKAMGRNGWDGANGGAKILVNSAFNADGGRFVYDATYDAPIDSVALGPANLMYNSAASLDLVAHEWGHGVIFREANFNINTANGLQFHEGFSDVIGQFVEKRTQSAGSGLEQSSDWVMHEDMATSGYARGALDDGTGGHSWTGPGGTINFDDRLHRLDEASAHDPHASGNMLSVVYRLMAEGGSSGLPSGLNPICTRKPTIAGCESSNAMTSTEYLGSNKASSILFHAIENTLTSSTTWSDVADRVNEAAFLKFNQCQTNPALNAAAEQTAVRKAFAGIGYPRTQNDITCP